MSKTRQIAVLFAEADRELLAPILDKLRAQGLRTEDCPEKPGRDSVVLAALSERFCADAACTEKLLGLLGAGAQNVLPLQLDAAPLPDRLKNALYARNIIPAAGRDAALIAERIAAALPKKKSRLPVVFSAAALVLIAAAGFLFWRNQTPPPPPETPTPVAEETPEPTPSLPLPAGITEEELAEVRCVVIVGEHFVIYNNEQRLDRPDSGQWPDMLYELASTGWNEQTGREDWYWHEDGSQATMTEYDLRFLSLMPNLEELHMALVTVTQAPDLSGLKRLSVIWGYDSELGDLSWLAASRADKLQLRLDADYSPLGASEHLRCAILDVYSEKGADFSAFSPKDLTEFCLVGHDYNGAADLSGLAACSRLQRVDLNGVNVADLSFLQDKNVLTTLRIEDMDRLRDISALSGLTNLRELEIENCGAVADYSPIGGCVGLQSLRLRVDGDDRYLDASFLAELPRLTEVELENFALPNLDFLSAIGSRHSSVHFSFSGQIHDYAGLAGVRVYDYLSLDPDDGATLAQMAPYLQDAEIQTLALRRMNTLDLSLLPNVTAALTLDRCGLRDLSGLPEGLKLLRLELQRLTRLSSLEGIQALSRFNTGYGTLQIVDCPRLADWSALDGQHLNTLEITRCFSLPSLERISLSELRLDSIADLEDLSVLDGLDDSRAYRLAFIGLDGVTSLAPVSRLHGFTLTVGPQLAEQAADLVEEKKFREYRVEYPDYGWSMDERDFVLLSLDELETLPRAMLRHIGRVCLAGDRVYDPEEYEYSVDGWQRDALDRPSLFLRSRETGEEERIDYGTIEDLSIFADLTGLQMLQLDGQSFGSLDGVQNLSSLRDFRATQCYALTDASALFSLEDLEDVDLSDTAVESIQGIQNLSRLGRLDLSRTKVEDFSPLAECDFTAACENGGVDMSLNELPLSEEDFAALGAVPCYRSLAFTDADPAVWIPALRDCRIESFGAAGDLRSDEDLAVFCADHPELRSLWIGWNDAITDLTPLLTLEELERASVHRDMEQAIASLEGQDCGFELEIQDW